MFNKIAKGLAFLLFLGLYGCQNQPVEVTPTGETVSVRMVASDFEITRLYFPESAYTSEFVLPTLRNFEGLDWEELGNALVEETTSFYLDERSKDPEAPELEYFIKEIPTENWLQTNVEVGSKVTYQMVEIYLPTDGTLREVVSAEEFNRYIEDQP